MSFDITTALLSFILVLSSLGIIILKNPVHAALSFLLTLLTLAIAYFQLSAEFIGAMQILVYAGAIMVIFIFVIVLFQDAYKQIQNTKSKMNPTFLYFSAIALFLALGLLISHLVGLPAHTHAVPEGFGTVQSLGTALYIDYFFPFEAVILLFLVALVGSVYIGRKVG